jgi:putative DNA primase/helicase
VKPPFPKGRSLSIATLAEWICRDTFFARDDGWLLYVYEGGVYRPAGHAHIARRVKELAIEWGQDGLWNSGLAGSVEEFIRADAPTLWETPPNNAVNLANGILDLESFGLMPHSPDHLSTIQLPVSYDREARCPNWESFVRTTFAADAQELAWEIVAWAMTPNTSIQKTVIFTGEGANGKSVFLAGLTAFLGENNVSAVGLHQLERDRFAVAVLYGKLANICPDIPATKLFTTSNLKAITGGDRIQAERKYHDPFSFRPFAKLLFSGNQLPLSDDSTYAFVRRLVIINFDRTFEAGAAETINREELDRRLSAPSELSGLLNKALEALRRIQKEGLSMPESVERAVDEYCALGNPFAEWLHARYEESPGSYLEKRPMIEGYKRACERARRPPMTDTAFGKALRRQFPTLTDGQRRIGGTGREVYLGIGRKAIDIFDLRNYG